jgi:hypothetical protein
MRARPGRRFPLAVAAAGAHPVAVAAAGAISLAALIAMLLAGGCAPRGEERARVVEREETRGGDRLVLRSEIRPARATLGDRVDWVLLAEVPHRTSRVELRLAPGDSSLEITALPPGMASRAGDRDVWRFEHRVRPFDLGPRPLPAALALIERGTHADSLDFPADTLFVDSLTAGLRRAIDADRGPLPTELRPVDLAVAAGAALLLAALVLLAARALRARRRAPAGTTAAPEEAPSARYRRELEALRPQAGVLSRDDFYERLAASVRAYVEGATGVPAPERTTRELAEELSMRAHVTAATRAALARTLWRADLAKFARVTDETAEALAALDEAARLAGALEPPPGPPGAR